MFSYFMEEVLASWHWAQADKSPFENKNVTLHILHILEAELINFSDIVWVFTPSSFQNRVEMWLIWIIVTESVLLTGITFNYFLAIKLPTGEEMGILFLVKKAYFCTIFYKCLFILRLYKKKLGKNTIILIKEHFRSFLLLDYYLLVFIWYRVLF